MHILEIAARWSWETSIAASILILPLLAAGLLLRKPVFTPVRHMLGLLVVARLLLPFSMSSPMSVFNWVRLAEAIPVSLPTIVERAPVLAPALTAEAPADRAAIRESRQVAWRTTLPLLWAIGVLMILARVLRQHLKVRKWVRNTTTITSGPAAEALQAALTLSKCNRRVQISSVVGLPTPALFGLFKPAILLPEEFVRAGDFDRLRLVCLHEIAHLRRMDVLINWLKIFAQALHWFNPLVWLVLRRLRTDQELLCDGDVMKLLRPEEHRSYGETLLALASPRNFTLSTLIPVSSNFKQLKERIGMIKQFKPETSRLLLFALPLLAATLAMLTFTAASPKKPMTVGRESQKETIVSEAEKAKKTMEALTLQTDMQRARVQELEKTVDELQKVFKISYSDEAELNARTGEIVKKVEADGIRAEAEHEQLARLLKELKEKEKTGRLRHVIPTAYRDEALDRLLENLTKSEQQLALAQKDYGADHPEVVRMTAFVTTLNRQIDTRVEGILSGLETLVDSKKAAVDLMNSRKEEAIRGNTDLLERVRSYFRAKHDLEIHQRILDDLQIRLIQESVDRELAPK